MASGLISVGEFHLFLERGGEPGVVAIVLQRAYLRLIGRRGDGTFMAEIIQQISANAPKALVPRSDSNVNYSYVVGRELSTVQVNSGPYNQLFFGQISEMLGWVDNPLGRYIRKVVQFRYKNGSKPGALRTIRVEKVNPGARGRGSLEGIDLDKVDLMAWKEGKSEGYRKYNIDRIQGEIKVLN